MACLEELQQLRFAKLHLHKTQDFWSNVQMRCTKPRLDKVKHCKSPRTPHTNCEARRRRGGGLGLICSCRSWAPCCHQVDHELLCMSNTLESNLS